MLLDWAARPKHARFRAKGDRVQRGPLEYRHYRKVRRAEENEEIRLRLTERTGKPTLALRSKRRERVLARHDRPAPEYAIGNSERIGAAAAGKTDEEFWIDLRDSSFDDANKQRLAEGNPPVRYNPITDQDEEMLRTEADTAVWPNSPVDPFAGTEIATSDNTSDDLDAGDIDDATHDDDADHEAVGDEPDDPTLDTDGGAGESPADETDDDDEGDQVTERVVRDLKSLPEAG